MHQFKAAQPALLYLSPACILSVILTALFRGEMQEFWSWTDEDEDSKAEEAAKPDSKKSEKAAADRQAANGQVVDVAQMDGPRQH